MKAIDIVRDCNRRMALANTLISTNYDLSVVLWKEAFDRKNALIEATIQASHIRYTTGLPADLRIGL